jgi:hypothetical protein
MMPASKVLCPLDFGALAVLPHGQIAGFCAVFRTFGGCINNRKSPSPDDVHQMIPPVAGYLENNRSRFLQVVFFRPFRANKNFRF